MKTTNILLKKLYVISCVLERRQEKEKRKKSNFFGIMRTNWFLIYFGQHNEWHMRRKGNCGVDSTNNQKLSKISI